MQPRLAVEVLARKYSDALFRPRKSLFLTPLTSFSVSKNRVEDYGIRHLKSSGFAVKKKRLVFFSAKNKIGSHSFFRGGGRDKNKIGAAAFLQCFWPGLAW